MSRPLRIEIADGIYHVTSRGLERRKIVRDDRDRRKWMEMLDVVVVRHSWRVFAWVLMSNHFHLFLQTPNPDLSSGMHDLNSGYVSWFNRRHNRVGPLFQGRFHAVLVERHYHYWELTRYIHLNPVRAGLADRFDSYPWGSCGFYFGARGAPGWLAWREILSGHGARLGEAQREYWQFLDRGLSGRLRDPLEDAVASTLFGSQVFVEGVRSLLRKRPPKREVPAWRKLQEHVTVEDVEELICREFGVSPDALKQRHSWRNEARSAAIHLSRKLTPMSNTGIGARFGGITGAAVSLMSRRTERRRQSDMRFDALLRKCETALSKPTMLNVET